MDPADRVMKRYDIVAKSTLINSLKSSNAGPLEHSSKPCNCKGGIRSSDSTKFKYYEPKAYKYEEPQADEECLGDSECGHLPWLLVESNITAFKLQLLTWLLLHGGVDNFTTILWKIEGAKCACAAMDKSLRPLHFQESLQTFLFMLLRTNRFSDKRI